MKENKLVTMSIDFSVKMLKFCELLTGHHNIKNQIERCSTSIGANIHEANYASGKADFIMKLRIALKECNETYYWLTIIKESEMVVSEKVDPLLIQCGTLKRLLIASISTASKSNKAK